MVEAKDKVISDDELDMLAGGTEAREDNAICPKCHCIINRLDLQEHLRECKGKGALSLFNSLRY